MTWTLFLQFFVVFLIRWCWRVLWRGLCRRTRRRMSASWTLRFILCHVSWFSDFLGGCSNAYVAGDVPLLRLLVFLKRLEHFKAHVPASTRILTQIPCATCFWCERFVHIGSGLPERLISVYDIVLSTQSSWPREMDLSRPFSIGEHSSSC